MLVMDKRDLCSGPRVPARLEIDARLHHVIVYSHSNRVLFIGSGPGTFTSEGVSSAGTTVGGNDCHWRRCAVLRC